MVPRDRLPSGSVVVIYGFQGPAPLRSTGQGSSLAIAHDMPPPGEMFARGCVACERGAAGGGLQDPTLGSLRGICHMRHAPSMLVAPTGRRELETKVQARIEAGLRESCGSAITG